MKCPITAITVHNRKPRPWSPVTHFICSGYGDDSMHASKAFLIRLLFGVRQGAPIPRVAHQGNSLFGDAQPVRSHQSGVYHSRVQRIKRDTGQSCPPQPTREAPGTLPEQRPVAGTWSLPPLVPPPIPVVPGEWIASSCFLHHVLSYRLWRGHIGHLIVSATNRPPRGEWRWKTLPGELSGNIGGRGCQMHPRNLAGNWLQPGGQLYLGHQE